MATAQHPARTLARRPARPQERQVYELDPLAAASLLPPGAGEGEDPRHRVGWIDPDAGPRLPHHGGRGPESVVDVEDLGLLTLFRAECPSLRERQAAMVLEEIQGHAVRRPGRTRFALSLAAVEHVGVAAVPMLIEASDWFRREGRRLVLCECPKPVLKLLKTCGVHKRLEVAKDLKAAANALA